jgi:hypothetical protein
MLQQGQVFKLRGDTDENSLWAYRYRVGGRGSRRMQRGGFASERDASEALERALERVRRERGCGTALTLTEFVDEYLAQHDGEPETIEKLGWLLTKAVKTFGTRRLSQLRSQEIAAWRMTIPTGHRFEATQALRQVLARAVVWGMIDVSPAKHGVDNPQRRYTEKRPSASDKPPISRAAISAFWRLGAWIALWKRPGAVPWLVIVGCRWGNGRSDSSRARRNAIRSVRARARAGRALRLGVDRPVCVRRMRALALQRVAQNRCRYLAARASAFFLVTTASRTTYWASRIAEAA